MKLEQFINIDWTTLLSSLITLSAAYLLTIPIGWDREKQDRSAGIRTFPLVAVACCAFIILGKELEVEEALGRCLQAVITGLGFLGGGVILKQEDKVRGMSTAVSIWVTGSIGIAVGLGRIEIAVILTALCLLSLRYGKAIK